MDLHHHIDEAVMPNITAERLKYNASLPADPNAAPGAQSAAAIATDEDFLKFHLDEFVRKCVGIHKLLPPPPPVSTDPPWYVVTRKQGLKALARANEPDVGLAAPIYEADIEALIAAMPETTPEEQLAKYDMGLEFRTAPTWRRGNQFFETLRVALGITELQRDALLQKAVTFQE